MLSDQTLAYAEELTEALLGVDALYRAESGDGDGLVVLNMSTTHRPTPFESYEHAQACFADLGERAATLPEPDRRLYYAQVCGSTDACIRWRQGTLPFEGQIAGFLHVPAAPASDAELDALRRELAAQPGFELQRFHDQLLSYGAVPVALIAAEMRRTAATPYLREEMR
jgi:hypothetical protein